MKKKVIKLGTRDSELAMWQAQTVAQQIKDLGYAVEIVPVKSDGDIILDKPLYELGITGIFTKTLDIALLEKKIDIAVHSMKDVPTALPQGIVQAAVLKRGNVKDVLIYKNSIDFLDTDGIIATGSLRRKAQWLHKYPNHSVVDLRGNVNTRMQKLKNSDWNGAIFAAAGLERINIKSSQLVDLDWMIPAPAQGAMLVVCREDDYFCIDALAELNHIETEIETGIERQFLRTLEGGCTAPIGAYAKYDEKTDEITFKGALFSLDGKQKFSIDKRVTISEWKKLGFFAAKELLESGAEKLMQELRAQLKK